MKNAYAQFSLYKPEESYTEITDTYMSDYALGVLGVKRPESHVPQGSIDDIVQPVLFKPAAAANSTSVEDMYKNYLNSSLGQEFNDFMEGKGYTGNLVDSYEKKQLGGRTIAQVEKERWSGGGLVTKLVVNSDYMGMLQENPADALLVMMHEHGHIKGAHDEAENRGYVHEFLSYKASQSQGVEKQKISYLADQAADMVKSYQEAA